MATNHTLGSETFAIWNQGLMQTNPAPEPLNFASKATFGNDANPEISNEPIQRM